MDPQRQNIIRKHYHYQRPIYLLLVQRAKETKPVKHMINITLIETLYVWIRKKNPRWGFTIADFALCLQVLLFICIFTPF